MNRLQARQRIGLGEELPAVLEQGAVVVRPAHATSAATPRILVTYSPCCQCPCRLPAPERRGFVSPQSGKPVTCARCNRSWYAQLVPAPGIGCRGCYRAEWVFRELAAALTGSVRVSWRA